MKKISFLIALMLMVFGTNVWADKVLDPTTNYAYLEDTKVQAGTTVDIKLKVCAENQDDIQAQIGTVIGNFIFPEGVTINSVTGNNNACNFNPSNNNKVVLGQCEGKEWVCTVNISVPADMPVGDYEMSFADFQIVAHNAQDDAKGTHTTTLTVQKSAVLEPQDNDFAFDILPAQISSETTYLPILMKNKLDVASYTLEVKYPAGITPKSGRGVAPKVNTTNLYSTTDPSIKALSVSQTISGQVAKYTVSNDETDTYMAKDGYYEVLQVPVTVFSTDAICNVKVKVSDIVAYDAENDVNLETPINIEGGEFMTTLIIGQPSVQEVILYGNYTSDVASTFSTALKNVAIADVTAATVADGVKFTDVLVNENGGNSYYTRTSANYGTTVLPLDLTTDNADKLYMIESMDAESIVLTEAENVAANTPCIFKGTINVEGATPTLGVPSEQGLGQTTYKGTYEATEIAEGAGYYISSNGKFYGDGATVRPFRGYFDGAIAGVKSLRVLLDDATGLIDITDQFSKEDIYNLQGIRMNNVQKGINIKGGKKILVK